MFDYLHRIAHSHATTLSAIQFSKIYNGYVVFNEITIKLDNRKLCKLHMHIVMSVLRV